MNDLPRGLLLDLDDTLVHFAPDADRCWREVCVAFAPELSRGSGTSPASPDRLFAAIRASADEYWSEPERSRRGRLDLIEARRRIVTRALAALGVDAPETGQRLADTYTEMREERVRPVPGALQALRTLRFLGVRTALLTNGGASFQRRKVERFGLEPLLDLVLIEGEQGYGKPDERVFLRALETLQVEPASAWMVGDNLSADIAPAMRLGVHSIWVDWRGAGLPTDAPARPDRVIQSFAELLPGSSQPARPIPG